MGTFSFKHVGKTATQREQQRLQTTQTPYGILTPLQPGTDEVFKTSFSLAEQVNDNLRNLVLTNYGERLGLYDFGANLRPLTTEFVTQDSFDSAAMERISSAVKRWMPYVTLENYSSIVDHTNNKNTAIVVLTLTYSVPALGVKSKSLEITLYVI